MTSMLPSLTKAFKEGPHPNPLLTKEGGEDNKILDNLISISFKVLFSFSILVFTL